MKAKPWLLLLLVLALALLSACGLRKNCEVAHNDDRTYALRICTDKKRYDFGEPVHITFTVTNISDETLEFDGGDKAALDICVAKEYWSDGRELTPELTRVTLQPSESHTIEFVWPTPRTDMEALSGHGALSISVGGYERPRPGSLRGGTTVTIYYGRGWY